MESLISDGSDQRFWKERGPAPRSRVRRFLGFSLLAGALVSAPILPLVRAPDAQAAVIYPPWSGRAESYARAAAAGADILSLGAAGNVVHVASPSQRIQTDLRRGGAWFVTDLAGVAGCAARVETRSNGT